MKNVVISLVVAAIVAVASAHESVAQIRYVDGGFLIGDVNVPHYLYDITANIKGVFVYGANNRYFQLDLNQSGAPKFSGHTGSISFYNPETNVYNAVQVSQVLQYSDARAKSDIKTFNSGLDVIKRLRPVSYNFTGNQKRQAAFNKYTGTNVELGLLAQELEEVLPNLVYTDEEGKKSVDYVSLIPVLIDAIQTLQQEIETLKSK